MCQSYRTDLTDEQWELLRQLIPAARVRRSSPNSRYAGSSQRYLVCTDGRMRLVIATSRRNQNGKRFIIISDSGVLMVIGSGFTSNYVNG